MILEKLHFTVNDELDFVTIKMGNINARLGYRIAFEVAQGLFNVAAQVARYEKMSIKEFRKAFPPENLDDCPRANRQARQSTLTPTARQWLVQGAPPLVGLFFDGHGQEMDVPTAGTLSNAIRRAARRAKAWAGDTTSLQTCQGILTDAEEDYKLGVG